MKRWKNIFLAVLIVPVMLFFAACGPGGGRESDIDALKAAYNYFVNYSGKITLTETDTYVETIEDDGGGESTIETREYVSIKMFDTSENLYFEGDKTDSGFEEEQYIIKEGDKYYFYYYGSINTDDGTIIGLKKAEVSDDHVANLLKEETGGEQPTGLLDSCKDFAAYVDFMALTLSGMGALQYKTETSVVVSGKTSTYKYKIALNFGDETTPAYVNILDATAVVTDNKLVSVTTVEAEDESTIKTEKVVYGYGEFNSANLPTQGAAGAVDSNLTIPLKFYLEGAEVFGDEYLSGEELIVNDIISAIYAKEPNDDGHTISEFITIDGFYYDAEFTKEADPLVVPSYESKIYIKYTLKEDASIVLYLIHYFNKYFAVEVGIDFIATGTEIDLYNTMPYEGGQTATIKNYFNGDFENEITLNKYKVDEKVLTVNVLITEIK